MAAADLKAHLGAPYICPVPCGGGIFVCDLEFSQYYRPGMAFALILPVKNGGSERLTALVFEPTSIWPLCSTLLVTFYL